MSIIITLIIFTVIVVIHEFGHFYVAKKCNVLVEEFAVGMGPKLYGKQIGETEYTLRLFPVGGFCRMADELENNPNNKIGFTQATAIQRILICIAGPVMNIILAFILMVFLSMSIGISTNSVKSVMDESAAAQADIRAGDKIIEFDNHSIHTKTDLDFYKNEAGNDNISITIKRNGEILNKNLTPVYSQQTQRYILGVNLDYKAPMFNLTKMDFSNYSKGNAIEYIKDGYWNSLSLVKFTVLGFSRLITAKVNVNELSGPIGVTAEVDNQYNKAREVSYGAVLATMINLMALLSANLGILNLIPIPAIDGGKILIYLIELVTNYRIPKEKEAYITLVGFVFVMGLGVYIAFNDILKLL